MNQSQKPTVCSNSQASLQIGCPEKTKNIFLSPADFTPSAFMKQPFSVISGAKKGTSDAQIQKRRPLFVANYPQKWWNRLLFHMNIIFG